MRETQMLVVRDKLLVGGFAKTSFGGEGIFPLGEIPESRTKIINKPFTPSSIVSAEIRLSKAFLVLQLIMFYPSHSEKRKWFC